MAAEILILEVNPRVGGGEEYSILAFYQISPVIKVGGVPVVPTPSDTLPPVVDEYGLVSQPYRDGLDSGALMFELRVVKRQPGQSEQDLINLVRARYPAAAASTVARLRRRYELTGNWVDA